MVRFSCAASEGPHLVSRPGRALRRRRAAAHGPLLLRRARHEFRGDDEGSSAWRFRAGHRPADRSPNPAPAPLMARPRGTLRRAASGSARRRCGGLVGAPTGVMVITESGKSSSPTFDHHPQHYGRHLARPDEGDRIRDCNPTPATIPSIGSEVVVDSRTHTPPDLPGEHPAADAPTEGTPRQPTTTTSTFQ